MSINVCMHIIIIAIIRNKLIYEFSMKAKCVSYDNYKNAGVQTCNVI